MQEEDEKRIVFTFIVISTEVVCNKIHFEIYGVLCEVQ